MKKHTLTLTILFLIIYQIHAQQIPNSNFENWGQGIFGELEPTGWITNNVNSIVYNDSLNVIKSSKSYSGNFSMRVRNVKRKDSIIGGVAFVYFPITKHLSHLTGKIKKSFKPGEVGGVYFGYLKNNKFITCGYSYFTGSDTSYKSFSVSRTSLKVDRTDSAFVYVHSYANFKPVFGSYIEVDSLNMVFSDTAVTEKITTNINNSSFHYWDDQGMLTGWSILGATQSLGNTQGFEKSTDAFDAPFALKIIPGNISESKAISTVFKKADNSKYLNGYTKFDIGANDTVHLYIINKTQKNKLLSFKSFAGLQSSYQLFSLSLQEANTGDTLNLIMLYQSKVTTNKRLSLENYFLIDALTLTSSPIMPLANELMEIEQIRISLSPNPSADGLFYIKNISPGSNISVADGRGLEVLLKKNSNEIEMLDLSLFGKGTYIVKIITEDKILVDKIIY